MQGFQECALDADSFLVATYAQHPLPVPFDDFVSLEFFRNDCATVKPQHEQTYIYNISDIS